MTLDGFFNIKTASELDIELCKNKFGTERHSLYKKKATFNSL